ncbi:MAG: hypothetical protein Q8867_07440 [Bacteroidota bacterium]|nr:hypothetical protein [Bacteroidota bacterium]
MKKRCFYVILIAAALLMAQSESNAQNPVNPVSEGTWTLNFGIGPGTTYWGNGNGFGPGFKFAAEKGMWEVGPGVFTLGGELGFSFFSHSWDADYFSVKEHWFNALFGARAAYHLGFDVPGLDVYGGMPLGFGISGYSYSGYSGPEAWKDWRGYSHQPFFPYVGVFFGGSYFFSPKIGVNAEVGYNTTYAQIGMVFKLN